MRVFEEIERQATRLEESGVRPRLILIGEDVVEKLGEEADAIGVSWRVKEGAVVVEKFKEWIEQKIKTNNMYIMGLECVLVCKSGCIRVV
jgi:hypothetical protein